jgi:hypothetical protein
MFEILSQLSTLDLTVILWSSMAVSVLGLVLTVRMIAAMRKADDRRILVGLVLQMLERGVAHEEITALLRVMGIRHFDDRFSAARRRLFRRYAKRRAAARQSTSEVAARVASRQLQPAV